MAAAKRKGTKGMKFSYSAVWDDVMALVRAHGSLIATIAGVFLFLPSLLLGYLVPAPETSDPTQIWALLADYFSANVHWFLLSALIGMIGSASILLLIFERGVTVGRSIAMALPLLPFYFLTSLAAGLIVGCGFVLLIVPGLYLLGRLSPAAVVVVAERRRNPVDAITRCFELTKGHGWAIFGLILLVGIAAIVAVGVATGLAAMAFVLVLGREAATLPSLILDSAANALVGTLMLLLNAAIYRQLVRLGSAAPADQG
jgi:hypothetical protein